MSTIGKIFLYAFQEIDKATGRIAKKTIRETGKAIKKVLVHGHRRKNGAVVKRHRRKVVARRRTGAKRKRV